MRRTDVIQNQLCFRNFFNDVETAKIIAVRLLLLQKLQTAALNHFANVNMDFVLTSWA